MPLWRNRFGGDPALVGKTIRLDDQNFVVLGIMPAKFEFPKDAQLWTPLAESPERRAARDRTVVLAVGRLKPGRLPEQAAAEVNGEAAQLARDYPATNRNRTYQAQSMRQFLIGYYNQHYLVMMLAAAVFVLLIACGNVANLQVARALGRTREIAVRAALGAARGRLVSQLLTESVLLAACRRRARNPAGQLGARRHSRRDAARGREVRHRLEGHPARSARLGRDCGGRAGYRASLRIVARAAMLTRRSRSRAQRGRPRNLGQPVAATDPQSAGRSRTGARGGAAGGREPDDSRLSEYGQLRRPHFEPASLLTLRLAVTEQKYPDPRKQAAFYTAVLQKTAAIPGVREAFAVTGVPYSHHTESRVFKIEGRALDPADRPRALYQSVSPNYFAGMRVPLVAGRLLAASDGPDAPRVVVISERTARQWWPGEPYPLGRRIQIEGRGPWISIAGVVRDTPESVFDRQPQPVIYVPYVQSPRPWMDVGVRAAAPLRLAPAVTAAVRSVDTEQPVTEVATLETLRHNEALGVIYVASVMGVFGVIALALSAIGVYGVMAYRITEQTHEIGIRMALGAERGEVLKLVLRRGLVTTVAGLGVGIVMAYGLARLVQTLIWGVTAGDPATFGIIPLALLAAAGLAIYIPARRAIRIDPIVTLRHQ